MKKMSEKYRKPMLFVLGLLPIAFIGGYFTGIYSLTEMMEEIKAQVVEQFGNNLNLFYLMTAVQTVVYAAVCGFIGYLISDRLGLMKPLKFEKKPVLITCGLILISGFILSLDIFSFRYHIPQIYAMYQSKPSFPYWMSSVLYGGIIEEVMMRLFVMSLLSFAAWKLFFRKKDNVPAGVLIMANVITALLFAAGHLPATVQMFGEITPLLLVRCFLLNGAAGIIFGYLYRTFGIHYAMMAHAGTHIVWKLIWIILL